MTASKDLEARVERLERAVTSGLNLDLAIHDSPEQAKARQQEADAQNRAQERARAKAEEE